MAITFCLFAMKTTRKRKHQEIAPVSVVHFFGGGSEISHLKRPCHAIPWVCLKIGDQTKSKGIIIFPITPNYHRSAGGLEDYFPPTGPTTSD